MTNHKHTPVEWTIERHIDEINKCRTNALIKLKELDETKLTEDQKRILNTCSIFITGIGPHLQMIGAKARGEL